MVNLNLQERGNANKGMLEDGNCSLQSSSLSSVKVIVRSNSGMVENFRSGDNEESISCFDERQSEDVNITGASGSIEGNEDSVDEHCNSIKSGKESHVSHTFEIVTDPCTWLPPEPEDMVDDVYGNVANNKYTDGTEWGQSSPLSRLSEDHSPNFKEEFRKAMALVMNGRFRSLVTRLLEVEDVFIAKGNSESWTDIVTSLAWEAAVLITPETNVVGIMHPEDHVKVKCIATGLCNQSRLVKGLVFKKNAAHKHMLTKHTNPKLLLLKGMLGHSASGLSSFDSMEQEKDNVKGIIEAIETCHPNVVLVERSVSRDVQESLRAKGITLVHDMKPHRLQRIARYADSEIYSSDNVLANHKKLIKCETLYFETFAVEHGTVEEVGKKPKKTLMFLEGCHRPFGCTILLKGAHSTELKKIKSVVHSAVVEAHHLILETSFLVDQRAMLSTLHSLVDVPISGESGEIPISEGTDTDLEQNSPLPVFSCDLTLYEKDHFQCNSARPNVSDDINCCRLERPHREAVPPVIPGYRWSSISILQRVGEDNFQLGSSASCYPFSAHIGCKNSEPDSQNIELRYGVDAAESPNAESSRSTLACSQIPVEFCKADISDKADEVEIRDEIRRVLDSQSILYLVSSQRISSRTICERSQLQRVKYYKNFDRSLGQFLHEILTQKHQCSACKDPREAHVYNYVNHSGKLTVRVKELPMESSLPGEAEGKLWMWAYCSRCKPVSKIHGSSRRVVMSTATQGLSFGKFLDLGLSVHSTFNGLSGCGHSLHTDYLRFYGLGPMVAMFTYSPINIYTTSRPQPVLEFNNSLGQDYVKRETEDVLKKGELLFTEVRNLLQNIGSYICKSNSEPPLINNAALVKEFSDVEEMFKQEKSDFEVKVQEINDRTECLGQPAYVLLSLNGLNLKLMLESYIWDLRLRFLQSENSRKADADGTRHATLEKVKFSQQKDEIEDLRDGGRAKTSYHVSDETAAILISHHGDNASLSPSDPDDAIKHGGNPDADLEIKLDEILVGEIENTVEGFQISKHQCEVIVPEPGNSNGATNGSFHSQHDGRLSMGSSIIDEATLPENPTACRVSSDCLLHQDSHISPSYLPIHDVNCEEQLLVSEALQMGKTLPLIEKQLAGKDSVADLHVHGSTSSGASSIFTLNRLDRGAHITQKSQVSAVDYSHDWIWDPFSEIHKASIVDLQDKKSKFFEVIDGYTPECLSLSKQLITEGWHRFHIPLGSDGYVVSAYEEEPTSIIACALALLHEKLEKEARKGKGDSKGAIENAPSLDSDVSVASPYWSSNGSLDSEITHFGESISQEESYTSFFDGSALVDPMLNVENAHPEILVGVENLPRKKKHSVVCLHEKQFRALRRRCCPCELDYISSLSRCKSWDAKGGKSGSLFVKTLDDRFVIKQIQKIECDSFLKFAQEYFTYTNQSLSSGSQSCLAKILGIYQVTIRQPKSGKLLKYDLMVMENLLFGRNIARLYDLKGTQHGRYISDTNGTEKVFLDKNFVEHTDVSPLYVGLEAKHILERAIWNDTNFLASINVMDYSLLVGVDMERLEVVYGIIDYLRQYTWDKQIETWMKSSIVVPKNVTPTVILPGPYKERFRKFMETHFSSVPGRSYPEISMGCCMVCDYDRSNSLGSNDMELERRSN